MKKLFLCFIIFALIYCSKENNTSSQVNSEPIPEKNNNTSQIKSELIPLENINTKQINLEPILNAVTFVSSFGDEDLASEFLLAKPRSIDVDDEGNVYILDEDRIKIYDNNGIPNKVVGYRGEGPGEFENTRNVTVSSLGYISVLTMNKYSFFSPDQIFIDEVYHRRSGYLVEKKENEELEGLNIINIERLDENKSIIVIISTKKMYAEEEEGYKIVYLSSGNSDFVEILKYPIDYVYTSFTQNTWGGMGNVMAELPYLATFLYEVIDKNNIAYSNTSKSIPVEEMGSYSITLLNLSDKSERIIQHSFDPVEITGDDKLGFNSDNEGMNSREDYKAMLIRVKNDITVRKYYTPLQKIISDRNYLFAFTYKTNDKEEILADVFNINTGKFINSTYFPILPDKIRNGKAYTLHNPKDDFAKVDIFSIDDKVYGR